MSTDGGSGGSLTIDIARCEKATWLLNACAACAMSACCDEAAACNKSADCPSCFANPSCSQLDSSLKDLHKCLEAYCAEACVPPALLPQCDSPPTPPSGGACVALGEGIACNPVTGVGCDAAKGEACDRHSVKGFVCYPPPPSNEQKLCDACSNSLGCANGLTCIQGKCAKYCCDDADCGTGQCVKTLNGASLSEKVPAVGYCGKK